MSTVGALVLFSSISSQQTSSELTSVRRKETTLDQEDPGVPILFNPNDTLENDDESKRELPWPSLFPLSVLEAHLFWLLFSFWRDS